MSCAPCGQGPSGPGNFCGPPTPVPAIVAGPQGATGPSGPTGPQGFSVSGATGPTGPTGQPGPLGNNGAAGATGATGPSSAPLVLFTGALWNPVSPDTASADLQALVGGRTIDMGQNPLPTGTYMWILTLQLGYAPLGQGPINLNGMVQLLDGTNPVFTTQQGVSRPDSNATGGQGQPYEATFIFQATTTNANELFVKASAQCYLLGATLAAWTLPTVVTSPGFLN